MTKKGAKSRLFQPRLRDHTTSVFRIQDLKGRTIWALADEYVAIVRNKPVVARAVVSVAEIRRVGLDLDPDGKPHPRHANIVNWPPGKSDWKSYAQQLAAMARVTMRAG